MPAMRSRFIARLTDIAFQASPPRGVGMLWLVSNFAIWLAPHRPEDRLPPTKTYGSAGRRASRKSCDPNHNERVGVSCYNGNWNNGRYFFSLQPRQQRASDDGTTRQRSVSSRFSIMTVKRCKLAPRLYRPCSGSDRAADREPRRNLPAAHHSGRALDQRHGLSAWLRSASIAAAR